MPVFEEKVAGAKYGAVAPGVVHFYDEKGLPKQGLPTEDYGLPSMNLKVESSKEHDDTGQLILPNIGELNAAVGEDSLRETLQKMRLLNLVACTMALLLEIPDFLGHVFRLHPARAILGLYLSFFAIILFGYELNMFLAEQIERYFGILYHPIGRSFLLLMMGGLSVGQGGILNYLLGAIFVFSAVYTTLTFIWYPEYRRRTAERPDLYEEVHGSVGLDRSWAKPAGETIALLKSATQQK
mmetsp:Transcript_22283/g.33693  ORF Transcript_22283/g.33693 Transcript_22283/m.33693 type:complete len:240 (+) Transcript_22283:104-823(+)|eukprot:CAMPEP_0178935586 /NCGR_PEP_ID=MMETSP0786-20121207/24640_1 /TAXON_ID=186022 /ORGANISM="Thalassionema frauenfeldii, Strain CCMP 1798" /LENGTH=239 /DNA_ID=CAMNT_0020613775 /DNA_START=91 /DNA_END=810 /DNA_ORIENTATION=-